MKKFITVIAVLVGSLAQSSIDNQNIRILDAKEFSKTLDVDRVTSHLQAFQDIAAAHGGTRAAGTPGHELSSHYVATQLINAGYDVRLQHFKFENFQKLAPATLASHSPHETTYLEDTDFNVMDYSPSGEVLGPVQSVDLDLGLGNQSTSGCEIEDFAGFQAGAIALIQRGTCTFLQKAENAEKAGASGVLIFNQGNEETRKELLGGTLGASDLRIPVFGLPYDLGAQLAAAEGLMLSMRAETRVETKITHNVIAETAGGDPNKVVMLGSHLDSVEDGPGINDNGSGSASILEVALRLSQVEPVNKVRFAWWGAEEHGLVGSRHYAATLTDEEASRIALYLNFDMVGSTNYIFGIYDGDGSTFNVPGPKGSKTIEKLFHDFFSFRGLNTIDVESNGRSDYVGFAERGIPFGGSFTGAEGEKTEEQARLFGGVQGQAYDNCYHKACDTMENISREALDANLQAIAFAALTYARSTEDVDMERASSESFLQSLRSSHSKKVEYPRYFKHKRIAIWER